MKLPHARLVLLAALLLGLVRPTPAAACGGFFCSSSPINQAQEVVVYGLEEDGSITMAVQVQYQGSDEDFAWILPLPVPPDEVGVGTDQLFSALLNASSPTFPLDDRTEGTCRVEPRCSYPSYSGLGCSGAAAVDRSGSFADAGAAAPSPMDPGVTVFSEETVGPYDTVVLGASTADAVVTWLQDNAYDVPETSIPLLAPYAEQGFVFIALRLTANRDSSVLRPIVLNMPTDEPCLPIRLTPIATTPTLPVVTFFLGDAQVRSDNYSHADITLDASFWNGQIRWGTAVATRVQELGGQAFATDYADGTPQVSVAMEELVDLAAETDPSRFLRELRDRGYPGSALVLDLISRNLTPPEGQDPRSYANCLFRSSVAGCGEPLRFDPESLVNDLDDALTGPAREAQQLVDRHPFLTRLSTTIRAEDMTLDPVFVVDADLPAVPRERRATRVTQCSPDYLRDGAPQVLEIAGRTVPFRAGRVQDDDEYCRARGGSVERGGCSSTSAPAPSALTLFAVVGILALRVRRSRRRASRS